MEKAIADYRESKKRRSEDSLEKTTPSKTWNAPFEGEDALLIDNLALLDEPDNVGYLLHRAATQYSLGQFDAAFADAVRAKELKKDSIGAYALCAEIYAIRNDLHAALAELEKGLRAVPNDLYLICLQANALKQLGNVDQATADIENAVRIDAKFASYYAEWGVELASQNRFDEAMAILNRVLELAPQCPQALEYRAKIQYSRKEWQSAQADLRQWAAFQPNEAEAFWLLAGVDLERQRLNDAIENLNLALEIDPEYVPALLARAQCLKEMNRYEEAMIDATEYVRLKPHDDEGLRIRGEIFYSLKKFKQAIADLDEAVRLNPQSGRDYFSRGFIKYGRAVYLSHTARYGNSATQAAGEPSASWSPWPAQSSETSNLSLGDGISKSFDEALDAEKMTEPNSINNPPPSIAQPLLIYPSTDVASAFDSEIKETERLVQTKLREALADLDEAVKLAPDSLTCHRTRLKICSLLYDDDAAVSSFDALIRLDPKNIQAYLERGDLHSRKHRYDEALADFQKVIDLDPENQSVYCRRACVYAIQGEEKKAEADLTKTGDLQKKS
jgi:tetratricopeptide (TPR) repeat protein